MPGEYFSLVLGIGTILLQIKAIYLIAHFIWPKTFIIPGFARNKYLLGICTISGMGVVGSLIYSNIIGFPPCELCWYQRIMIYGVFLISTTALIKKYSKEITAYIQTLSGLGIIIAIYHVITQFTGKSSIVCMAGGVECTSQYVFTFGYISIPVMSLTILAVIFLISKLK